MANTVIGFGNIVVEENFSKVLRQELDSNVVFRLELDLGNDVLIGFRLSNHLSYVHTEYNTPLARALDPNGIAMEFLLAAVHNFTASNRTYIRESYSRLHPITIS
jgi:hypothetical protein